MKNQKNIPNLEVIAFHYSSLLVPSLLEIESWKLSENKISQKLNEFKTQKQRNKNLNTEWLPQIEIGVVSICTIYRARFRGSSESLLSLPPPSSSSPTSSPSLSASSPFSLCPTSAYPSSSWSRSAPPRATRLEIRSSSAQAAVEWKRADGGCSLCLTGRRCRSRSGFALLAWYVKRSRWHGSPESSAAGEVFCRTLAGVYGLRRLGTEALALVNGEWMYEVRLWFVCFFGRCECECETFKRGDKIWIWM